MPLACRCFALTWSLLGPLRQAAQHWERSLFQLHLKSKCFQVESCQFCSCFFSHLVNIYIYINWWLRPETLHAKSGLHGVILLHQNCRFGRHSCDGFEVKLRLGRSDHRGNTFRHFHLQGNTKHGIEIDYLFAPASQHRMNMLKWWL